MEGAKKLWQNWVSIKPENILTKMQNYDYLLITKFQINHHYLDITKL